MYLALTGHVYLLPPAIIGCTWPPFIPMKIKGKASFNQGGNQEVCCAKSHEKEMVIHFQRDNGIEDF